MEELIESYKSNCLSKLVYVLNDHVNVADHTWSYVLISHNDIQSINALTSHYFLNSLYLANWLEKELENLLKGLRVFSEKHICIVSQKQAKSTSKNDCLCRFFDINIITWQWMSFEKFLHVGCDSILEYDDKVLPLWN